MRVIIFFFLVCRLSVVHAQNDMNQQVPVSPQTPPAAPAEQQVTTPPPSVPPGSSAPSIPQSPAAQIESSLSENQATATQPEMSNDKYFYDETEGRDPFRIPRNVITTPGGVTIVENEDSLEGAPIPSGVKVLAIIYDSRKPRALIRKLSSGKTYTAYVKSRVGQGGGIVKEITEDEVVIQRSVEVEGETKVEIVSLKLNDKDLNK